MPRLAKTTFQALVLACGLLSGAQAADFRAHGDTIELRGQIADGDDDRFRSLLGPDVQVLRIRSVGGSMQVALAIARQVHEHALEVDIDGLCASACAELILPAARHVRARDGSVVALHGVADGALRAARREGHLVSDDPKLAALLAAAAAFPDEMDAFLASVGVNRSAMDFMYELTSDTDVHVSVTTTDRDKGHVQFALTGARGPICRAWLVGPEQLRALGVRAGDWSPGGPLKASLLMIDFRMADAYTGPVVEITPEDHALDCRGFNRHVEQSPGRVATSSTQGSR